MSELDQKIRELEQIGVGRQRALGVVKVGFGVLLLALGFGLSWFGHELVAAAGGGKYIIFSGLVIVGLGLIIRGGWQAVSAGSRFLQKAQEAMESTGTRDQELNRRLSLISKVCITCGLISGVVSAYFSSTYNQGVSKIALLVMLGMLLVAVLGGIYKRILIFRGK